MEYPPPPLSLTHRCPDTNKPLGLMLLNGLTKLINEYKEVSLGCVSIPLFSPLSLSSALCVYGCC